MAKGNLSGRWWGILILGEGVDILFSSLFGRNVAFSLFAFEGGLRDCHTNTQSGRFSFFFEHKRRIPTAVAYAVS